jgi:hypothetical protein
MGDSQAQKSKDYPHDLAHPHKLRWATYLVEERAILRRRSKPESPLASIDLNQRDR